MNELTDEQRELLEWVLQTLNIQDSVKLPEIVDLGLAPDGLNLPYYGMSYKHQLLFLKACVSKMEE